MSDFSQIQLLKKLKLNVIDLYQSATCTTHLFCFCLTAHKIIAIYLWKIRIF